VEVHSNDLSGNPFAAGQVVTSLPSGSLGSQFVFRVKVTTEYSL
jgi:hypothetical protein